MELNGKRPEPAVKEEDEEGLETLTMIADDDVFWWHKRKVEEERGRAMASH
jgi:hypothetical protein